MKANKQPQQSHPQRRCNRQLPLFPLSSSSMLVRVALFLDTDDQDVLFQVDPRLRELIQKRNDLKQKDDINQRIRMIVADPDTLLARLNTRRLRGRVRYLCTSRRATATTETEVETDHHHHYYYSLHKTTAQLAVEEWNTLLERAKNKNNNNKQPPLPSPYELLLFSPCPRPVTVLASYPRSGNSLLRNLFERATLRVTGSDMRGGLTQHDLVGEAAVTAKCVQFVKTHYPERVGASVFPASRAVLLVRNPYDALESYFNLMMTNTHTASLSEEQRRTTEQLFEEMVMKEIQVWRAFHQFWLRDSKLPILLVRYEDLIRYPDKVLARVCRFVLEVNNMTFFNQRIQQCVMNENSSSSSSIDQVVGAYKPRSGGIGKSLHRYGPRLRQKMKPIAYELMHQLGYGEMLKDGAIPSLWKLDPIPNYGFELPARESNKIVKINSSSTDGGMMVRGPKLRTDWKALRKQFGVEVEQDDIANAYHEQ